MGMSLEQYVQALDQSGILTACNVRDWTMKLPPEERPLSAHDLAQLLVRQRKLTKLEAAAVYQEKTAGLEFGNYHILDKIASGGMGLVYKARRITDGQIVALKVVLPEAMESADTVERFRQEIQVIQAIQHPHLVAALAGGSQNGVLYLAMEFIDGQDLKTIVEERGPFPLKEALEYTRQAAEGLAAIHRKRVVHRDVKPSNLMLDRFGKVRLLDLGLARMGSDDDEERLTRVGSLLGTAAYISPEQIADTRNADCRTDIYSLGCTLCFLLTGLPPYVRSNGLKTLLAHREDKIPKLSKLKSGLPEELNVIFEKMLAKQPKDRYQAMDEVIEDLANFISRPMELTPAGENPVGATPAHSDGEKSVETRDNGDHSVPDSADCTARYK